MSDANRHATQQADIVLEGGGVRGIGHVGALCIAEQLGYRWRHIAGTSAGAFVAALLAADYSAQELYHMLKYEVDFKRFAQEAGLNALLPVQAFHLLRYGGMHSGNYIENFIREKLQARDIQSFKDLVVRPLESKTSPFRYRLTVIASDISNGCLLRLPQNMHKYGLDPDELDIARAVRMSASIPFFFLPIAQRQQNGNRGLIVDGGLLSNFPVSLFDVPGQPRYPTFGLRLVDSLPTPATPWPGNPTSNIIQISKALLKTMMSAHDRLYMDDHTFVRTIAIPVEGISATQFNLSAAEADRLYQNGRKAAEQFFTTWDFEAYKAAYREQQSLQGRRERLHEQMKHMARQTKDDTRKAS